MKKIILLIFVNILLFSSCKNSDVKFDDFDYSTVYFSYQYPVRTVVLGEDVFDNTLDNQHKVAVYATMGGVYQNLNQVSIGIEVDNSLCDDLYFEDGETPVLPLPSSYYSLAANKIVLDGDVMGGVEVSLTDAFFADEKALENCYVLPIKMTNVSKADSILVGTPRSGVDNPVRTNPTDWDVLPKDYVLYAVKYINPYHAFYLRRGVDNMKVNGSSSTVVRSAEFVEDDEVCSITTTGYLSNNFPVTIKYNDGTSEQTINCDLTLEFDQNKSCTISSSTPDFKVTGSGKWVDKGESLSWGNQPRSALYLEYNIDYKGIVTSSTKDTLVLRNRGVAIEELVPVYKK